MNKTNSSNKLRILCESAIMVALALALSYIEIKLWANGGSIDLVMIPIFVLSFRRGAGWGMGAGLAFGVLKCLMGEGLAYGWQAMILDYAVAYMVVGLCGIWKNPKSLKSIVAGVTLGSGARLLVHFISGIVIWGEWMPESFMGMNMSNIWVYSILYNGSYMLVCYALALVVLLLVFRKGRQLVQVQE